MNDELTSLITRFNEIVDESEKFLFIARASELQENCVTQLKQFMLQLSNKKSHAIESENEDYANMLLGCECVIQGIMSELELFTLLKQSESELAWDKLIDAQMSYKSAVRAHDKFEHISHHFLRMEDLERLLFPPQLFMSFAAMIEKQECSICQDDYENCEHIKGRPYMGEFCHIKISELKIDHVSLVDDPANKRARVVSLSAGNAMRNQMTWRIEAGNKES